MTGRNILLAALRNGETSRPAWVPFVGVHGAKILGVTAADYLHSSDLIVRGLSRASELYRPDGLPLVFDLQMEAEVLGCGLTWPDETPPAVNVHPLTRSGVENLPPFDTAKGRYPLVADALKKLGKEIGNQVALYGLITGPFTLSLHLMGTNVFLRMFDDPGAVKRVLAFCSDVGRKAAEFYLDHGAEVIAVVDPMTSQIPPKYFTEFVQPYVSEIFEHIRAQGGLSSFFVCGNATRNLDLMCRTPCDNVSVDENISLDLLRDLAQKNGKSFGGNLKLTTALLLGDELDAKRDALRCIDIGGTKGFVLAPGCDLPYAVPEANLQAVAEVLLDPYQREVARAASRDEAHTTVEEIELPDYASEAKVIVDVVTLDSASCAPCQYMVGAVKEAASKLGETVLIREHKITTRNGLGHMAKLGVGQIPTICIDGQVRFPSIIPDVSTLIRELEARVREKKGT
jgi:uroporphyrinogen decarboxylase